MTQEIRGLDELRAETLVGWDKNAAYFDGQLDEDGDEWQRELIGPVVERLLGLGPKDRLLEVACGNGEGADGRPRDGDGLPSEDDRSGIPARTRAIEPNRLLGCRCQR